MGDRLFFAPIESPRSVIDIGTGTGLWAIDMADAYPDTEVLGTDLSICCLSFFAFELHPKI